MRVVATLCTFNEAGALPDVIADLRRHVPGIEVIIIDDDSPDGTADIAGRLGATVIRRAGLPRGRGWAGRAGYEKALSVGADAILEMDADGSHDPADAPAILAALQNADIAVGSRAASGGADNRGFLRRGVSSIAKIFLRSVLRLPLTDPTSGYRAFRRDAMEKIHPATLIAEGPEIVEEVYLRARKSGLSMTEVPITFQERTAGESKLTAGKLMGVLARCIRLSTQTR